MIHPIPSRGTNSAMMNYPARQKQFQQSLCDLHLDGYIVVHPANLRYLCGYSGSNGLLLFLDGQRVFLTDGRYTQQAREEVSGARVVIARGSLLAGAAKQILLRRRLISLGFEGDHTTVAGAAQMREAVDNRVRWKAVPGLIERQRILKDADELRLIADAVKLGADAYHEALPSLRPGVRESEVAGRLEFAARQRGADGMSFETIVAAGKRAALPHGRASCQPMPRRGFVVIDSGVILRGYCSDMTRTLHLGRVGSTERQWYDAVLEAQLAGIAAVAPGRTAGEIDAAARRVLRKAKLHRYFTHSTGHGVGLEIHEAPRLGQGQSERLEAGMVITIEPGVYIPGKGGIRIEDMVVVTPHGSKILTPVTKERIEL